MTERNDLVITKRSVDALSAEGKDAVFWDRRLPRFGVRVCASGREVYVVQSRGPGGSRRSAASRRRRWTGSASPTCIMGCAYPSGAKMYLVQTRPGTARAEAGARPHASRSG